MSRNQVSSSISNSQTLGRIQDSGSRIRNRIQDISWFRQNDVDATGPGKITRIQPDPGMFKWYRYGSHRIRQN